MQQPHYLFCLPVLVFSRSVTQLLCIDMRKVEHDHWFASVQDVASLLSWLMMHKNAKCVNKKPLDLCRRDKFWKNWGCMCQGKWPAFAEIPCCGAAVPEAFSEFEVLDHLWQNCAQFRSSNYRLLRVHINIPDITSSASREIFFFKIKMLKNMGATVSNQFLPLKKGQRWITGNIICETGMSKALSSFIHLESLWAGWISDPLSTDSINVPEISLISLTQWPSL